MSLAQGSPFVLTYRLHIIGLAQECNWVTCRVCFVSQLQVKPVRQSAQQQLKCGRLTTSLAGCKVAQLIVTSSSPDHLHNLSLTF